MKFDIGEFLLNSVDTIHSGFKSITDNWHEIYMRFCAHLEHNSLNIYRTEKITSNKNCTENWNTRAIPNKLFQYILHLSN
jgi:hypothetical protein